MHSSWQKRMDHSDMHDEVCAFQQVEPGSHHHSRQTNPTVYVWGTLSCSDVV